MSLQARSANKENAGVAARGAKPGEAPSKQVGPSTRKGLSEMGKNQTTGLRQTTTHVKTQTKAPAKRTKAKRMGDDDPIDPMYLASGFGGGYSDPLVERLLACDLRSDDTWGIGAPSLEMDHFDREHDRFGLMLDYTTIPDQFDFKEPELELPEANFYVDDF